MNKELTNQAMGLFDSSDKWFAYLELISKRAEMENAWFRRLDHALTQRFMRDDIVPGWVCQRISNLDFKFHLTEDKEQAVSVFLGWFCELHLRINTGLLDTSLVSELLRSEKYSPLLAGFNRVDRLDCNPDLKVTEYRNYSFDCPYDGDFSNTEGVTRLSWFAGNRTEELADQIQYKINRFRKSDELSALFSELRKDASVRNLHQMNPE